jgi:hypothetical protein
VSNIEWQETGELCWTIAAIVTHLANEWRAAFGGVRNGSEDATVRVKGWQKAGQADRAAVGEFESTIQAQYLPPVADHFQQVVPG